MSDATLQQLTLFAEASHARTCQLPDHARAWLESEADFGTSSREFLATYARNGLSSKTFPVCYQATEVDTLPSSFKGWSNAGMASPGGFLTLSISEWPSDAAVCSLSDVLETENVAHKYYLSARACRGILRRAAARKKTIPPYLATVLRDAVRTQ